jgi:hypothetical protein
MASRINTCLISSVKFVKNSLRLHTATARFTRKLRRNSRMIRSLHNSILSILVLSALVMLSCSGQPAVTQTNANAQPSSNKTRATGTITANPNPIQVCDKGLGQTTLTWTSTGAKDVELHATDGVLLAKGASGTFKTGRWCFEGAEFYLQDVSEGKPLSPETKIAVVRVTLTTANCP